MRRLEVRGHKDLENGVLVFHLSVYLGRDTQPASDIDGFFKDIYIVNSLGNEIERPL